MNCFALTDKGNIRKQNQDTCFTDDNFAPSVSLAVVCDGMGGAKSGKLASSLACDAFVACLRKAVTGKNWKKDIPELLTHAVNEANAAVYKRGHEDADCFGMGTTLVAVLAVESECCFVNVGDSRAYRSLPERIQRVTRDHSLVAELVERGQISEEQSRTHPHKNLITRAVGTEKQVKADTYCLMLQPEQSLLLCSDGLSNLLLDEEMQEILRKDTTMEEQCQALLNLALQRGAPDNVTAVLCR